MPTASRADRLATFITAATEKHDGKYDYSQVPAQFVNAHTPVSIGCPDHGEFPQTPNEHRRGQRCPDCSGRRGSSATARRQQFIAQAQAVHGNRFGYSNVVYVDQHTAVTITCRIHGPFPQRPDHHTSGVTPSICPDCASAQRPKKLRAAWKHRPRAKRGEAGRFVPAA
ncbi:hypothetical protein [Curtobacterium flaccumfaciens]|uniref:hypothetical protein n=1 Tax=Curtobacterium flaccumfaciens TaxID=2035 RepID=UPI001129F082|nr:hypothetical protein [Curtobacterium flaccumfaciens]